MLEKYGQKVLHYLVNPRDPRYFFKGEQELYKQVIFENLILIILIF